MILSNDGTINNVQFSGAVFFDCTTSVITLSNVTAETAVLRCDSLSSFFALSGRIDRLVFAARSGDVAFSPGSRADIGTAVVGSGSGTVTLSEISRY
jgi:hypothetical protein